MDGRHTELDVRVETLPDVHVACVDYLPGQAPDDVHLQIARCFERVRAWVVAQKLDPWTMTVGIIETEQGRLVRYGCAIQIPRSTQMGSEGIEIRDLAGGRCAILRMEKDPDVIGRSINQFHEEYFPAHRLSVDRTRPTYEVYSETTMDYCVPVL